MSSIPTFTITVVTLAALIYCTERLLVVTEAVKRALVKHHLYRMSALHEATINDVEPTFRFWWMGQPSDNAKAAVMRDLPPELIESMPQGMIDLMIEQPMEAYRLAALHLAVHANMDAKEAELRSRLPRIWGIREQARLHYEEHQAELANERSALMGAGIDVDKLEADFAPSS